MPSNPTCSGFIVASAIARASSDPVLAEHLLDPPDGLPRARLVLPPAAAAVAAA
jgi:hypothetical protein